MAYAARETNTTHCVSAMSREIAAYTLGPHGRLAEMAEMSVATVKQGRLELGTTLHGVDTT